MPFKLELAHIQSIEKCQYSVAIVNSSEAFLSSYSHRWRAFKEKKTVYGAS